MSEIIQKFKNLHFINKLAIICLVLFIIVTPLTNLILGTDFCGGFYGHCNNAFVNRIIITFRIAFSSDGWAIGLGALVLIFSGQPEFIGSFLLALIPRLIVLCGIWNFLIFLVRNLHTSSRRAKLEKKYGNPPWRHSEEVLRQNIERKTDAAN